MLNMKAWLETTGMKVADTRFIKPPPLPYVVFIENSVVTGADNKNCITERLINIELYSDTVNYAAEQQIENLLNEKSIKYSKNRTWIELEKFFQTVYDFNLVEKF